jgi:hypothetical protein
MTWDNIFGYARASPSSLLNSQSKVPLEWGVMKTRFLVVNILGLFVSTFAFAQKTHIDWDKGANFANYHTYAWETSPNPAKGDWNQRIINLIDQQLQAKGLTKVDSKPDMWAVYSNSVRNEKDVVGVGYGLGPAWGWNNSGADPVSHESFVTRVGTLVVELADTKNKQLLWRGSVSDTITDNDNKNINNLDKSVAKLFKEYPPKEKD